jgi:hypothetical protein
MENFDRNISFSSTVFDIPLAFNLDNRSVYYWTNFTFQKTRIGSFNNHCSNQVRPGYGPKEEDSTIVSWHHRRHRFWSSVIWSTQHKQCTMSLAVAMLLGFTYTPSNYKIGATFAIRGMFIYDLTPNILPDVVHILIPCWSL